MLQTSIGGWTSIKARFNFAYQEMIEQKRSLAGSNLSPNWAESIIFGIDSHICRALSISFRPVIWREDIGFNWNKTL